MFSPCVLPCWLYCIVEVSEQQFFFSYPKPFIYRCWQQCLKILEEKKKIQKLLSHSIFIVYPTKDHIHHLSSHMLLHSLFFSLIWLFSLLIYHLLLKWKLSVQFRSRNIETCELCFLDSQRCSFYCFNIIWCCLQLIKSKKIKIIILKIMSFCSLLLEG